MTHDPSRRLATAEEIMNGKNPFERVSTPLGEMERWRAEAMLIGTTGGMQSVLQTVRDDAAELEKKTAALGKEVRCLVYGEPIAPVHVQGRCFN
jgi:hypothetical protein